MTGSPTTTMDLAGATAIVTGANSGIGLAAAKELARLGASVILAVRDPAKGARAAETIAGVTKVCEVDLADLESIRRFADDWRGPIDLLINNAGVSVPDLQHTTDGFELQFGTNHLGPFALTNRLLPHLTGRVVSVASLAERAGQIDLTDLNWERKTYNRFRAYANSKLANLLFTSELHRRLRAAGSAVRAMAAHPGYVATNIYNGSCFTTRLVTRLLAQAPEQGARPVLYAATAYLPGDSITSNAPHAHARRSATDRKLV